MTLTTKFLKDIMAEARPIIERQLDDAEVIAGLRDVFSAQGGDWGALKALIKSHIQDERDEVGDGKRIRKIRERAGNQTAYADMLGLGNMNEKYSSSEDDDAELSGLDALDPDLLHMLIEGSKSEAGLTVIRNALAVVQGKTEPGNDAGAEAGPNHGKATASASNSAPTEPPEVMADEGEGQHGAQSLPDQSSSRDVAIDALTQGSGDGFVTSLDRAEGEADGQPIQANDHGAIGAVVMTSNPGGDDVTSAGKAGAPVSPPGDAAEGTGEDVRPSLVPTFNEATHFLNSKGLPRLHGCTNPDACAGSHRKLCFGCSVKHDGPAYVAGEERGSVH